MTNQLTKSLIIVGAGTTALVSRNPGRNFYAMELNADYIEIANRRLDKELGMFR